MKTIKTIVENKHLTKILVLLGKAGVLGTTVEIADKKEKTIFKDLFKSNYTLLVTTCSDAQKTQVVNKIFPVITLLGGICIA